MHTNSIGQVGAQRLAGQLDESDQPDELNQPDQAAAIADAIGGLLRIYGNLNARLANTADSEIAALFLLVRLVKSGPKRAKELAEEMSADPSTVSRQVAILVKTALIERQADPDDGRACILVPTALGIDRVQEHFTHRGQMIEPIISEWPDSDRAHFLRLLRSYSANLESRREHSITAISRSHVLRRSRPIGSAANQEHSQ